MGREGRSRGRRAGRGIASSNPTGSARPRRVHVGVRRLWVDRDDAPDFEDGTEGVTFRTIPGIVERIRAMRARRAESREERRAARSEHAQKKAQAEAVRLEHRRHTGEGGFGGGH